MNCIKFIPISIITLAIEITLFFSLPQNWTQQSSYVVFFFVFQILLIPSVLFLFKKKFETFSVSCILLLCANFFTPSFLPINDYKTLPPNFFKRLIVRGDVMPNFEGINTISTDEMGFRSLSDIDYNNNDSFRIFAIGASTTEEIFVDDNQTWTSLLQISLNNSQNKKFEVINTGVSGLRARHHLATMMQTENYYPNAYIFLMGVNDWNSHIKGYIGNDENELPIDLSETLIWKGLSFAKMLFSSLHFDMSEEEYNVIEEYCVTEEYCVSEEYGIYYSLQNNSLERNDVREFFPEDIDSSYESYVRWIATRCNNNSYLCIFVSQPSAYSTRLTKDLKERLWMTPPNVEYTLDLKSLIAISQLYNQKLFEIANENNIHFCDLAKEIPPTIEYFYDDVHFNENGSTAVAEVLHGCLSTILNE
ncbi:SGNH/GDSL hydrolase family protein [Alteromonas sp. KUL42]|uniref:SGNH/GDSL hydrolase family protein n=1 Tax=Alteromonas sp. KUL42 TaxID=2480797 RepID=UPI000B279D5E|nr:SGNH/GDSL hydrolase family protein [Alteromonas sp. KUL42]